MPERRGFVQSVYVEDKAYFYCVAKPDMQFILEMIVMSKW